MSYMLSRSFGAAPNYIPTALISPDGDKDDDDDDEVQNDNGDVEEHAMQWNT